MMAACKRVQLFINPESRHGRENNLEPNLSALHDHGFTIDEIYLHNETNPFGIVRSRVGKYDALLIGGGDGILNIMADTVLASGLPLGILPFGTGNDLARTLNIPFGIRDACEVIAAGHLKRIDLTPAFIFGRHVDLARVTIMHDRKFEIHTDRPMFIDTDGELTSRTPGYFDILPNALEVFVPAGAEKSAPQE